MTPQALAVLHRAAFRDVRPWSAAEFSALLDSPHTQLFAETNGFALARNIAGESEVLTLAVHPDRHRQGIGRKLTMEWLRAASQTCDVAHLEVAADNVAARALYAHLGFAEVGRRKGYYARENGQAADALALSCPLPWHPPSNHQNPVDPAR